MALLVVFLVGNRFYFLTVRMSRDIFVLVKVWREIELSSNGKHDFYVQANFKETLFEIQRTVRAIELINDLK